MNYFDAARSLLTKSRAVGVATCLILTGHAMLSWRAINNLSATFDEPMHVAAGYSYWARGDMRLDPNNPPLAKMLLTAPLLIQPASASWTTREWQGGFHYAFGERFFYWSGNDADAMLASARSVNLMLSLLLLVAIWRWSAQKWGEWPSVAACAVAAASPTLLAHASLATNDMSACLFAVAGILACADFVEKGQRQSALAAGLCAAAGMLSKYSAILLVFVYLGILMSDVRGRRRAMLLEFARWAALPWLVIMGAYVVLFPDAWSGFSLRLWQVYGGFHPVFVLGRNYPTGWLGTYALAMLVKSTPVELGVLAVGFYSWKKQKTAGERAPWILAGTYLLAATFSHKQIGLRYVLPIYPAIALIAGRLVALAIPRRRAWLTLVLAVGQGLSAFEVAPEFLGYFNGFAGGMKGGYRLLGDSNLDWGQDLKMLGAYLRAQGPAEVILSYFGTAAPDHYGIFAQHAGSTNSITRLRANSNQPARELYVVSATHLQGTYAQGRDLRWVVDRPLLARVGAGLFVYDVTRDVEFHRRLADYYAAGGESALAEHERVRVHFLAAMRTSDSATRRPLK